MTPSSPPPPLFLLTLTLITIITTTATSATPHPNYHQTNPNPAHHRAYTKKNHNNSPTPRQTSKDNTKKSLITKACAHSTYKDLCERVLHADPASKNADIKGLTSITVRHTTDTGKRNVQTIDGMVKNTKDRTLVEYLKGCYAFYNDAVTQMNAAQVAVDGAKYNDASVKLQAAMYDVEACKEGFGNGMKQPMLDDANTDFKRMCSNALAFVNLAVENFV
ncbi:hypothetical protein Scep_024485 [Stephania cephalantha]|uniref:Pectinesterase inhibitor domain-containing protein n=1 Tax=Stephania cephalantha TaxID=152367 RepID=A0AAP0HYH8_9MAGN